MRHHRDCRAFTRRQVHPRRPLPMVATRLLLALALAGATACAISAEPSQAPVRNVDDTYFGTTVHDPYRYFENTKDPEVAAWMKAHSDHAHALLQSIAGRDALLKKIE